MIKGIIFDCYGVLVGQGGFRAAYVHAGGDVKRDEAFIHQILDDVSLGKYESNDFYKIIADRIGIPVERWLEIYKNIMLPDEQLLDFIRTELKPRYKIGLLSNANHGSVEDKLTSEQLGLFDAIVISADVGMIKPDPAIYQLAAKKIGLEPEECIFTDDNELYVEAAKQQGMKAFLYKDFVSFIQKLERLT